MERTENLSALSASSALANMLLDLAFERGFGHRADYGVDVLAVLEEEDARDGTDVEPHGGPLIRVHVDLGDLGFPGIFSGQLIQDRRHDLAGPAPRSPKIYEHETVRLLDLGRKGGVAHVHGQSIRCAHFVILQYQ